MNISFVGQDCVGCGSCELKCPYHAVKLTDDREGFFYPHVLENTCTDCGLCIKHCPQTNIITQKVAAVTIEVDRSGSLYTRYQGSKNNPRAERIRLGLLSLSLVFIINFAKNKINRNLATSEGWNLIPATVIHLVAPPSVRPKNSTDSRRAMLKT